MDSPEHLTLRLGAALGIGLLIGAERERRKGEGRSRPAAGLRTFALTALAGAVTLLVGGELLLAVSAASVAVFSAVAYRRTSGSDPGLTSEMALFATLLLGALAVVHPGAAAGLGVIVTALLAARTRLHRFVVYAPWKPEASKRSALDLPRSRRMWKVERCDSHDAPNGSWPTRLLNSEG